MNGYRRISGDLQGILSGPHLLGSRHCGHFTQPTFQTIGVLEGIAISPASAPPSADAISNGFIGTRYAEGARVLRSGSRLMGPSETDMCTCRPTVTTPKARDISKCRRTVPVAEIRAVHDPTERSESLHGYSSRLVCTRCSILWTVTRRVKTDFLLYISQTTGLWKR